MVLQYEKLNCPKTVLTYIRKVDDTDFDNMSAIFSFTSSNQLHNKVSKFPEKISCSVTDNTSH